MKTIKLAIKNLFRHKLRTSLTILGIAVAIMAFGLIRTVITSWNYGVEAASAERLITRHAVSFTFPLPYSYYSRLSRVPGVKDVSFACWFGGVYKDKNNFFVRLAVDADTYFRVYPEYVLSKDEYDTFLKERNSCVIGRDLAQRYHLKVGDRMTLQGDIYPGNWDFVIRGIYQPKNKTVDATLMLFHYSYINERIRQESPARADYIGWYIEKTGTQADVGHISGQIDAMFKNSNAETKTETEKEFQQSMLSYSSAIISAMDGMSFVIIGIIMLVLCNTMIMSARERTREYAVLKAIGFPVKRISVLIFSESMMIAILGGIFGVLLTYPLLNGFEQMVPKGMFPIFEMAPITLIFSAAAVLFIGLAAALFPVQRVFVTKIVDGFRFAG